MPIMPPLFCMGVSQSDGQSQLIFGKLFGSIPRFLELPQQSCWNGGLE